jgi:hypothetical protein
VATASESAPRREVSFMAEKDKNTSIKEAFEQDHSCLKDFFLMC